MNNSSLIRIHRLQRNRSLTVVANVSYNEDDSSMDIELSGDEMGILIGKRGQTLDSLQYLVSLVVNKDTENYIRASNPVFPSSTTSYSSLSLVTVNF